MTRKPRKPSTSAEDSRKGGATGETEASRSVAVSAERLDAVASDAASTTDTEGAEGVGKLAEAPIAEIPAARSSSPPDGAAPSDHTPQVDGAAETPLVDRPGDGVGGDGGPEANVPLRAFWIVTCAREGGRRRNGRRWAYGETEVDELTEEDIAALEADPDFAVQLLTVNPLQGGT